MKIEENTKKNDNSEQSGDCLHEWERKRRVRRANAN